MDKNETPKEILSEFTQKEKTLKDMGVSINALLNNLMKKNKIDTHSISHRIKDSISLERKIKKKNKYNSLSEITDVLGVRIITFYSTDIDSIERIIREEFEVDEKNSIDKRKSIEPDRFGYMSLHYIVSLNKTRSKLPEYSDFSELKFEIQIRTILQHSWAEIEHKLGYKSNSSVPDEIRRLFSILSGTLELVDKEFVTIKEAIHDYDLGVRNDLVNKTTTEIPINEISLIALIDLDENLESLYTEFKQSLNIHDINPGKASELADNHITKGVAIINSLGFHTISDLQLLISSLDKNTIFNFFKHGKHKGLEITLIKYTFFMTCIYIEFFRLNSNLDPAIKELPSLEVFADELEDYFASNKQIK